MKSFFLCGMEITQPFGNDLILDGKHIYQEWGMLGHNGIDCVPKNKNEISVHFWQGDTVLRTGWDKFNGNFIVLWDSKKLLAFWFCHLLYPAEKDIFFKSIFSVGFMGSSGYSTAPHLHFGACKTDENAMRLYRDNGYNGFVDPMFLLED